MLQVTSNPSDGLIYSGILISIIVKVLKKENQDLILNLNLTY